jgi:LysR family transcriptional regulator for bpeEF and oprC
VPALAEVLGRYPRISIDVTVDSGTVDLVEDGIDVAIQLGRPAGARLIARKLCPIHYALCAAPDYLRRYGAPRTIAELAAHRCVTYMQPEIGRYREWELRHNGRRTTAAVAGVLGVNDIYALLDAVVAGVGIGYLTDFMIAEALAAGKLAIVMPETAYEGIPAYIHYLPSRYRSPRIRVFVDFLVELLRQPPAWHIDKLIAQQQVLQPG